MQTSNYTSPIAPTPPDEAERIEELNNLKLLDTEPEERFERFIQMAVKTFNVPIALISLVDVKRQWFKGCHGLSISETSRDVSFCAHTILQDYCMVIPDALKDARFANNALVKGPPYIRFYAGYPVRGPRGYKIGSMCIIDFVPRTMSKEDEERLKEIALSVTQEVSNVVEYHKRS